MGKRKPDRGGLPADLSDALLELSTLRVSQRTLSKITQRLVSLSFIELLCMLDGIASCNFLVVHYVSLYFPKTENCVRLGGERVPGFSDRSIRRDLQTSYDDVGYRLLRRSQVQRSDGGDLTLWVSDLAKVVQCFSTTEAFRALLSFVVRKSLKGGQSKLSVILYHDEVVPGNPLAPDHSRKGSLVHASFLQFGQALRREEAWLPIAVVRSKDAKMVKGKLSACIRCIVQSWVDSGLLPRGFDVELDFGRTHITVDIIALPADEDALKKCWDVVGASGNRCCLGCLNAVTERSGIAAKDPSFVSIAEHDFEKFIAWSDAEFYQQVDDLTSWGPHLKTTPLATLQTAMGINFNENGLAADTGLRKYIRHSMSCFDGMHCLLSNGIANFEVVYFLEACEKKMKNRRIDEEMREMLSAEWCFPHCKRASGLCSAASRVRCFSESKVKTSHYRGNASQLQTILPLLAFFVCEVVVPDGRAGPEATSFVKLCVVVMEWIKLKRQSCISSAASLKGAWEQHLIAFKASYGRCKVRPKHHYTGHLPPQCEKLKFALDCTTQERKADSFKHNVAENATSNAERFTFSTLSQLLVQQLVVLDKLPPDDFMSRLLPPAHEAAELSELGSVQVSAAVVVNGMELHASDVVLVSGIAVTVECCLSITADDGSRDFAV